MSRPKIHQLPNARVSVKTVLAGALEESDGMEAVALVVRYSDGRYGVRYSATSTEVLCAMTFALANEAAEDFG